MKKIFISYHHKREQTEKNNLSQIIRYYSIYYQLKDMSVESGDIDTNLSADVIYRTIRENYLKDTDVTLVILGKHTKCRKHVDREIGSSLRSYGFKNTKNGLLILLTEDFIQENSKNYFLNCNNFDYISLITQQNSGQRIFDNVKNKYAVVTSFSEAFSNISKLKELIEKAHSNAKRMNPDNSAPFRSNNTEDCPLKFL